MQIVVPMSGLGSRFVSAGYKDLKPFIPVHKIPIIEHVVSLFPGETDVLFVCRDEHLNDSDMEDKLKRIAPTCRIVPIKGERKGPVWAVAQAFDEISESSPVIVNYCDFFMRWDYNDFKTYAQKSQYDGIVVCYKGFHPHLLHEKNVYASCKVNGAGLMEEIREKYSFTEDKSKSPQSAGTYYFKSGELLKKYYKKQLETGETLNGEYYSSLTYNHLIKDGLKVGTYNEVEHFCQWGTPEDLSEYLYWSKIFKNWWDS